MIKVLTVTVLLASACGETVTVPDATAPDTTVAADHDAPPGDCHDVCPDETLAPGTDDLVCASGQHCMRAPACADICEPSWVTCTSANNCRCHLPAAVVTCVR